MKNEYDVIIIGAGIGGLAAGAILARNGKKILILEKNPVAGGYAVNFRRGDFEFDVSLHMIDGCDKGKGTHKVLEKCGILSKIQLLKPQYLYRSIYPDFDIRIPQNEPKEYLKVLIKNFPHERINIENLFKEMSKIFYEIRKFLYTKIPLWLEIPFFFIRYPKLFYYANKSVETMLNKYLKDHKLKAIIAQLWGYYGLPPSKMSPFYFSYGWHDYLYNGGYYVKGGSFSLTNAFSEVIEENQGKIMLSAEVQKIIIEDKTSKGIITNKGDKLFSRIIVSNIDIRKTFNELIGASYLSAAFIKKVNNMEPSPSAFIVYLGLNINLLDIGIKDYEIFYNPSYDLDRQLIDCINNDMDKALFLLTIYSNADSDYAHKGKSILEIMTLAGYDFWKDLSKSEYKEKKIQLAQKLIRRVETIIPNLSSYIETIEIATPITMEKYTGNYKGSIYGASQLVSQSGLKRLDQKTPIKNLYLVGAWTVPGEGISGVVHSGEQVAERILRILR